MSYYAVVLVPVRVELEALSRPVASEEAREWARHQKPVGEHTAKVLQVQYDEKSAVPAPRRA